ncbi:DUF6084 family protein [Actinomadura sp. 9N215]|uniref:DUF6084 family protein n=1 Tax=Actinomadura sp. 9N215 TaxID=3375150 RepID=UPI0037B08B4D
MNGPPELGLEVLGIEAGTTAATPVLSLRVGLRRVDGGPVQCVLLTTTVTIAAAGLSWARAGATVPTFRGGTELTLTLPCRPVVPAVAEQCRPHTVDGGGVPLDLAFDGTVFYPGENGTRAGQAPWRHETTTVLPVRAWRDLLRDHDPREGEPLREGEPTA